MISIITINYNQNAYTLKCVESILRSEAIEFEICLVDNGSTEENYAKLKREIPQDHRLKLHRMPENKGYVGGINYGLESIDKNASPYILILNNDTIIDPKAAYELVKTLKSYNDKAIVSGKVYHYDTPTTFQDVGYSYKSKKALKFNRIGLDEEDKGQFDLVEERDMLDDVFWVFHKDLYAKIGNYSTYFWFNAEQADFAMRAKEIGYKLIYTYKAKLWHKGSVSIGGRKKNPRMAYWHIQSTLIFRFRHLSLMQFVGQYTKLLVEISAGYANVVLKRLRGNKESFDYINAKFLALCYFNKWLFLRNENTGYQPY